MQTPAIDVNLDARHGACSTGRHDSKECEPILIPCPIPRSATFEVTLGECWDAARQAILPMAKAKCGLTTHHPNCPARPIRVSCSIGGDTWDASKPVDFEFAGGVGEPPLPVIDACRDRWALVKALVNGEPFPGESLLQVKPFWKQEFFAQRDAVYATLAKAHRAEDALIDALGDYEEAMRGAPVGIYGLKRESHGALERYVVRLIEQVGAL